LPTAPDAAVLIAGDIQRLAENTFGDRHSICVTTMTCGPIEADRFTARDEDFFMFSPFSRFEGG